MTTARDRRYGLRQPCPKCPFRTDVEPYLRPGRAAEIAAALRAGGEFPCHVTTVRATDDAGDDILVDDPDVSRFCAGALATLEREGTPNQMMRIAARLGLYDPDTLNADAQPVHPSLTAWVRSHYQVETVVTDSGEVLEFQHCEVVDGYCEDPAGYGGPGGAYANDEPPTCNPLTDECTDCARLACPACRSAEWNEPGDQWCTSCYNEEEL